MEIISNAHQAKVSTKTTPLRQNAQNRPEQPRHMPSEQPTPTSGRPTNDGLRPCANEQNRPLRLTLRYDSTLQGHHAGP